jgi:signal transduction histidine kinase
MDLTGIHHLTAVSADIAGNYRFYTQVMGMRLVKRSVNQDDVSAYHLFYSDAVGSPGNDLTFFDWRMPREQRGSHSIVRTALRVNAASLEWWLERLRAHSLTAGTIEERDGRSVLDFEDLGAERELRLAHETMEQCVAQRTRELSEAVGQLEFFNRVVSHDLRGPLGGIASISELIGTELERGNLPVVRDRLSLMESHTRRLARLVEDLFNLTRVSSGRLAHVVQPLDAAVAEAIEVLGLSTPAERIACVSIEPLPTLGIDRALMRQVFVNLIGNALKFTSHLDGPRIEVRAHRQGDEWVVAVADNGRGFDARRAGDLFKPFTRLHGGDVEGSGIGLTIVRRIVERHGGRVWAESPEGGGARFCFSLPPHATPA